MSVSTFFTPYATDIGGISNTNPCMIHTTTDHGYQDGLSVRIFFPIEGFGMEPLANQQFPITVIDAQTFSIPIDSTNFNPFNITIIDQNAQCIPTGEFKFLNNVVKNNNNIIPEL